MDKSSGEFFNGYLKRVGGRNKNRGGIQLINVGEFSPVGKYYGVFYMLINMAGIFNFPVGYLTLLQYWIIVPENGFFNE